MAACIVTREGQRVVFRDATGSHSIIWGNAPSAREHVADVERMPREPGEELEAYAERVAHATSTRVRMAWEAADAARWQAQKRARGCRQAHRA